MGVIDRRGCIRRTSIGSEFIKETRRHSVGTDVISYNVIVVVDVITKRVDLLRTLTSECGRTRMREDLNAAGCVIKLLKTALAKEHA